MKMRDYRVANEKLSFSSIQKCEGPSQRKTLAYTRGQPIYPYDGAKRLPA